MKMVCFHSNRKKSILIFNAFLIGILKAFFFSDRVFDSDVNIIKEHSFRSCSLNKPCWILNILSFFTKRLLKSIDVFFDFISFLWFFSSSSFVSILFYWWIWKLEWEVCLIVLKLFWILLKKFKFKMILWLIKFRRTGLDWLRFIAAPGRTGTFVIAELRQKFEF